MWKHERPRPCGLDWNHGAGSRQGVETGNQWTRHRCDAAVEEARKDEMEDPRVVFGITGSTPALFFAHGDEPPLRIHSRMIRSGSSGRTFSPSRCHGQLRLNLRRSPCRAFQQVLSPQELPCRVLLPSTAVIRSRGGQRKVGAHLGRSSCRPTARLLTRLRAAHAPPLGQRRGRLSAEPLAATSSTNSGPGRPRFVVLLFQTREERLIL